MEEYDEDKNEYEERDMVYNERVEDNIINNNQALNDYDYDPINIQEEQFFRNLYEYNNFNNNNVKPSTSKGSGRHSTRQYGTNQLDSIARVFFKRSKDVTDDLYRKQKRKKGL
jgi:hypothetical protein